MPFTERRVGGTIHLVGRGDMCLCRRRQKPGARARWEYTYTRRWCREWPRPMTGSSARRGRDYSHLVRHRTRVVDSSFVAGGLDTGPRAQRSVRLYASNDRIVTIRHAVGASCRTPQNLVWHPVINLGPWELAETRNFGGTAFRGLGTEVTQSGPGVRKIPV